MNFNNALKIAVLPLDIKLADRDENLISLRKAMASLDKDTDLIVLPELFSTGFIPQHDEALANAEPCREEDDITLTYLRNLSREYRMAIAGTYLKLNPDGRPLNRAVFVEPSGEYTIYDKHHLFGLSAESNICVAGDVEPPVIRYRGWNISVIICYDLRFPCWCRNRGLRYDLLLVPANWPSVRQYAWKHLLIARAIENQAVVVGANRSGSDTFGDYDDNSFIIDYDGKVIDSESRNSWIYATVEREKLQQYRQHFPFYADADV